MDSAQKGVIEGKNLTLVYERNEPIIKDINFTINKGDFIFVTGVSGSGKSTFLKALYGELKPVSGSLSVNGQDALTPKINDIYELRKTLGVVFQDYKLIQDITVRENVAMPLLIAGKESSRNIDASIEKILSYVNVLHKSERYPTTLSGGEQQRVSFARALVSNPDIILADEPTGNLDDYSANIIFDLLTAANSAGKTIIVVTHHIPTELKVKYKVFNIENGGLVEK